MFDRFNKKGEVTVHDLAILLIQLDTFFEVCLLEDLGIEIPVKKERARSVLRAVSTSIKRMVSKNREPKPESPPELLTASRPTFPKIDLGAFTKPVTDDEKRSVKELGTGSVDMLYLPEIPPPKTPEEQIIDNKNDILSRLTKLETAVSLLQTTL
jgi:hypothetical protein